MKKRKHLSALFCLVASLSLASLCSVATAESMPERAASFARDTNLLNAKAKKTRESFDYCPA